MKLPRNLVLGVAAVLIALPIAAVRHWGKPALELVGTVAVTDGDSLDMSGVLIRLHGIDAPEHDQRCRYPDGSSWSCGHAATVKLVELTSSKKLVCWKKDTDRYGRVVAVCFADGEDIGAAMVRMGFATAYRRYSTDYVTEEQAARLAKRGIWNGTFQQPEDFRRAWR
jgi:endonuclease YncB( thermonuclease family)